MVAWSQTFKMKPLPYGATERIERRKEFKEEVHSILDTNLFFVDDIKLEITVFLDQQETYETDNNADLDNYAKMIIDCLKGFNGIIIDDTQIQSLHISWIDTGGEPYFTIYAYSDLPDTTSSKNFKLYEMPDNLWYPIRHDLSVKKGDEIFQFYMGLVICSLDISCRRKIRQKARAKKLDKLKAYRISEMMTSSLRGFHKSRILESGFEMVEQNVWKESLDIWKGELSIHNNELLEMISGLEKSYEMRLAVLDTMPE